MKRLLLVWVLVTLPLTAQLTTVYNPWTKKLDYVGTGSGGGGTSPITVTFDTAAGTCTANCTASTTAGTGSTNGVVITHNLSTSSPEIAAYDASGAPVAFGGLSASVSVTDIVATSSSVVTVSFSGAARGTIRVSTGGMGPTGATGATGPTGATGGSSRVIGFKFDGGGSALSGTLTGCKVIQASGTITGVYTFGSISGSATVGIRTIAYASYVGIAGYSGYTSIVASAPPSLVSAFTYSDSTLTGWTTALTKGQYFCVQLSSPTTVTDVTVEVQFSASN